MDREVQDAEALRALLAGNDVALDEAGLGPDELDVVGLFQQATGVGGPEVWDRIAQAAASEGRSADISAPRALTPGQESAPERSGRGARWALAAWAIAASVTLLAVMWPEERPPLPPGATTTVLAAAGRALDPHSGPPLQRLGALHDAAAPERRRLVAELSR